MSPCHLVANYYSYDNSNRQTNSETFGLHGSTTAIQLTPASSSSKFLLLMSAQIGNDTSNRRSYYKFYRDSTGLGNSEMNLELTSAYSTEFPTTMQFLDSPNTTSQITYSLQFHCNVNNGDYAKINYQRFSILEFAS